MKNKDNESSENVDDPDWISTSLPINLIIVVIIDYILDKKDL